MYVIKYQQYKQKVNKLHNPEVKHNNNNKYMHCNYFVLITYIQGGFSMS